MSKTFRLQAYYLSGQEFAVDADTVEEAKTILQHHLVGKPQPKFYTQDGSVWFPKPAFAEPRKVGETWDLDWDTTGFDVAEPDPNEDDD